MSFECALEPAKWEFKNPKLHLQIDWWKKVAKFENEKFEREFPAFLYNFGKGISTLHDLGGILLIFNFIAYVYDKLWEYELFEIWFCNFLSSIFSLSSSPKLAFVRGEEWALNVLSNQLNENSRTRNYTFKSTVEKECQNLRMKNL